MIRRFFIAIQFLTRIPVPASLNSSEYEIGKSAVFFPLVGLIVGGAAALVFTLLQSTLPLDAAVLCAIASATLLTNGFHEDGLADTFDGLGGGRNKDHALQIMRDSRIGTYGTLALIFFIAAKVVFISSLPQGHTWRWLIVAHTAARWTTLPLCSWLPYARAEGHGKLVAKQVGFAEVLGGTVTLLLASLLLPWQAACAAVFVVTVVTLLSGLYFRARLEGVTGDCLGATNQLTEVSVYLTAVVLPRFY